MVSTYQDPVVVGKYDQTASHPQAAPHGYYHSSSKSHSSSNSSHHSSRHSRPRSSSASSSSSRSRRRHHQQNHHHQHHHQQNHQNHYFAKYNPNGQSSCIYCRPKSSSAKNTPMHDDSDAGRLIPVNQPAQAIDYLESSFWKNEEDIAESWKFMTKQKHDVVNGLRLENASWRNWAKQRHRLKSIHPKALNWLKDSDTTWLYGPLYKADIDDFDVSRFGAATGSSSGLLAESGPESGSDDAASSAARPSSNARATLAKAPKSVLKRKMPSELFKADTLFPGRSELKQGRHHNKADESAVFKEHRHPKLRFNISVEQCVSVDNSDAISEEDYDDDEYEDEDEVLGVEGVERYGEHKAGRPRIRHDRYEVVDGAIVRISAKRRRRPPRSIVRILPTRLKAANWQGMEDEYYEDEYDLELDSDQYIDMDLDQQVPDGEMELDLDPEMDLETEMELEHGNGYDRGVDGDVEDEEGLFDESVYTGYPYPEPTEADYPTSEPFDEHLELVPESSPDLQVEEVDQSEVSYVRPWNLPRPSDSSSPIDHVDEEIKQYHEIIGRVQERCSMLSPTPALRSQTPSPTPPGATVPAVVATSVTVAPVSAPAPVPAPVPTPVLTVTLPLKTPRSRPVLRTLRDPITVDVRTPVRSSQGWASIGAEMKQVVKVGYHQSAADLVSNVMDIVSWASSIVYYSPSF